MFFKCIPTLLCYCILRIWFSADESFVDADVFFFLKCFDMGGQVAVGDLQKFFQGIEIIAFVRHQHAHDLEPDPVLKCLIEMIQRTFHRSYLKCMMVPYTIWRRPNPIAHKIKP